jgi:plasmid stabilization system protein ParE
MIERVEFNPNAQQEVADSFDWYESSEVGLGDDFLASIDHCIRLIRSHPEMFPIAFKNYRKALLTRFPFVIFYRVSIGTLTVYAVFHCSKNPVRLTKRLS